MIREEQQSAIQSLLQANVSQAHCRMPLNAVSPEIILSVTLTRFFTAIDRAFPIFLVFIMGMLVAAEACW